LHPPSKGLDFHNRFRLHPENAKLVGLLHDRLPAQLLLGDRSIFLLFSLLFCHYIPRAMPVYFFLLYQYIGIKMTWPWPEKRFIFRTFLMAMLKIWNVFFLLTGRQSPVLFAGGKGEKNNAPVCCPEAFLRRWGHDENE